jgi:hypothetical protein
LLQEALSKTTPSAAAWAMCGARVTGCPWNGSASGVIWSAMNTTTFGRARTCPPCFAGSWNPRLSLTRRPGIMRVYCRLMPSERLLPPLAQLLAFEAAARHRSFSAAATAHGTSQPAVSQRIAAFEADSGTPLFRRTPRGVQPTPEGADLFAALQEGLDIVEAAIGRTPGGAAEPQPDVATDFGFAAFWLVPRLASPPCGETAPDLDVRVMTAQG